MFSGAPRAPSHIISAHQDSPQTEAQPRCRLQEAFKGHSGSTLPSLTTLCPGSSNITLPYFEIALVLYLKRLLGRGEPVEVIFVSHLILYIDLSVFGHQIILFLCLPSSISLGAVSSPTSLSTCVS